MEKLENIILPPELEACCNKFCHSKEHRLFIDGLYNNIVTSLREAAEASAGTADSKKWGCRKRVIAGWNKYVREAHDNARASFINWAWNGKPQFGSLYEAMRDTRRIFKQKLKFCQDNKEQVKMDILASEHKNKHFQKFWKSTQKLGPRSPIPVSVDGMSNPKDVANMFMSHFRVTSPLQSDKRESGAEDIVLGDPTCTTVNEINDIIKSMTKGKSPGHDGLSIEHLKLAGPHLPRVLSLFFNLCTCHLYLPSELMRTIVVPIVKNKTGDTSDKSNYRPISLATVIAKVLDGVFERRVSGQLKIHDAQFGFRPGLSTETAVLALKHTIRYYTDRSTPVYAAFLDLSKAFDLVNYNILWSKLGKLNLPTGTVNLLKYWYEHQINQVRWSGALSEGYRLECGVRQGGLTSPALFNLYVNQLIEELSSTSIGCSVGGTIMNSISYADDMVLLSPSIKALRLLLGVCERYAESHGLRYNTKKSEVMVFRAGNKKPSAVLPLFLCGEELNRVSKFKYLGHIVTEDLKDDLDMERERRALSVRCNMLARRFARCTREVKLTLFKAYCQSMYTCSLWVRHTQKIYNVLRIQYNNAFRVLLGLPRFCSASTMFAQAHTDGFQAILRKRTASLQSRLRGSSNRILKVIASNPECPLQRHWIHLHCYGSSATAGGRYMN